MSFEVAHVKRRRPGAACAPGPASCNVRDRCRVVARSAVPAAASLLRTTTTLADAVVFDSILYVLRTGCAWRHLPRDFPPWATTLRCFLRLARTGTFERIAHALVMADRGRRGRQASPMATVVDAHAVRSGDAGVAGVPRYDAAKLVVGRKQHALVDTDGCLLLATVLPASLHDSHGGIALLSMSRHPWPSLALYFAHPAYAGTRVATATPVAVQLIGRAPDARALQCSPVAG